jgi:hypothetical protein
MVGSGSSPVRLGSCEEDLLGGRRGGPGRPVPMLIDLTGAESSSFCTSLGVGGSESAAIAA